MGHMSLCVQGMKQLQALSCSHVQNLTIQHGCSSCEPHQPLSSCCSGPDPALGRDRHTAMVCEHAGEKTVAHGHKPGCLMTSEEKEDNAHAKQMMAMQWLQSNHDCSYLLHLIPTVPTQQCAWETFHDSPLELLTQEVGLNSFRPFSGMAKFTQETSRTLKTVHFLLSSDFSIGQHSSCSKTRRFIGSNLL